MDEEYKVCWKNFQDNIASGFQNLYDRGDLVDVTLAVDGKLLQAHKTVLAICSPYFQEIFISNPCQHPIIILKDVSFAIMCEILEFMYQGVVNVKHAELPTFMKIGQLLQIKGLAKNMSSSAASAISPDKSPQVQNTEETISTESVTTAAGRNANHVKSNNSTDDAIMEIGASTLRNKLSNTTNKATYSPSSSPAASPVAFTTSNTSSHQPQFGKSHSNENSSSSLHQSYSTNSADIKRPADYSTDSLAIFSRKQFKRASAQAIDNSSDHNNDGDAGMDANNTDDFFFPHVSMVEGRFDAANIKRDVDHHALSTPSPSLRNAFSMDYNLFKNSSASSVGTAEYPNDLHMPNDYSKNYGNHMEVPPNNNNNSHTNSSNNVVMLSSTSLLHKNCIFNRNNTVATQQGMKTYWLCKSYRISMCRARCITHQGRIISATGVHNHTPHMRSNGGNTGGSMLPSVFQNDVSTSLTNLQTTVLSNVAVPNIPIGNSNIRLMAPNSSSSSSMFHAQNNLSQTQQLSQQNAAVAAGAGAGAPAQSVSPPPSSSVGSLSATHLYHPGLHDSSALQHHQSNALLQAPGSVIHNMMHNASAMMHMPSLPNLSHISHHHHHHQHQVISSTEQQHEQQQQQLDITPLMHASPGHLASPPNRNNSSLHAANSSMNSPNSTAAIKSPNRTALEEHQSQQHIVVQNEPISPELGTAATDTANTSQAQVIDSITISPTSLGHTFKIENM